MASRFSEHLLGIMLVSLVCSTASRADDLLTCDYRPASSVEAIGVHETMTATFAGHTIVAKSPSPGGPWTGHVRVRVSLATSTVWRDSRTFRAQSGPSAVSGGRGVGGRFPF